MVLIFSAILLTGCGRAAPVTSTATPPTGSFALEVSPGPITIAAGLSQNVSVSLQAQGGFSGSVTVTVGGLPANVTVSPSSITLTNGTVETFNFAANSGATPGTTQITFRGADGSIQSATMEPLTIDTFAASAARPFTTLGGQILHGFYDESRQLFFATNVDLNEVDVLSGANGSVAARIPVPQPVSIDQLPDGKTLLVGTMTQSVSTVDENTYLVTSHPIPNFSGSETTTLFPQAMSMANGKVLIFGNDLGIEYDYIYGGSHLVEWDMAN
jgi:hypothetical protein